MIAIEELRQNIKGGIRLGESLAPFTPLGIGGPAEFLVEPDTEADFIGAVRYFHAREIPFILIRRGSNVLVAGPGYRGAAISIGQALGRIALDHGGDVRAGAGAHLAAFVDFCIERALAGAEIFSGQEGTVGGAIVRNALTGKSWSPLVEVEVLREGAVLWLGGGEILRLGRDAGTLRDVILGARFRFPPGEKEALLLARRENLIANIKSRPVNIPGGTVMFRDPPGDSAANLIKQSGLRSLRRGPVTISVSNANVLIRTGNPSPEEVFSALRLIQQAVRRRCGVTLEPCIALIGFDEEAMREVA